MSLENRLHLQSEDPDLLIEFDLPPGTHATIGASPKSEITLPLTGIPPFSCVLGRLMDSLTSKAPNRDGETLATDAAYVDKHLGELVKDPDLSRYIL